MGDKKLCSLSFRSTAFYSSICSYYWCQKCFHGSVYAWHVVIAKGFCYSRSPNLFPNLLLRKQPTYMKSKLEHWLRIIDFPDLVINCAYRFKYFFSQSGCRFREFPLSLSYFKLECRCSPASKTLIQAQRQSLGPHTHGFSSSSNRPICRRDRPASHEQPASLGYITPKALGGLAVTPVFST